MDLSSVISAIEIAVNSGLLATHVRDWFRSKTATGIDGSTAARLQSLPASASPAEVAQVIHELYGFGGNLTVSAGSDGGGDLRMSHTNAQAGSGPRGGGNLTIKGGDGGPHGKGGDTVIVGGTYKAGDAK